MGARGPESSRRESGSESTTWREMVSWWPDGDADLNPSGCRLLTMHGTADTWTDPVASQAQTSGAAARGVDAQWVPVDRAGHFLVRNFALWHRLTADFAMAQWPEPSQA